MRALGRCGCGLRSPWRPPLSRSADTNQHRAGLSTPQPVQHRAQMHIAAPRAPQAHLPLPAAAAAAAAASHVLRRCCPPSPPPSARSTQGVQQLMGAKPLQAVPGARQCAHPSRPSPLRRLVESAEDTCVELLVAEHNSHPCCLLPRAAAGTWGAQVCGRGGGGGDAAVLPAMPPASPRPPPAGTGPPAAAQGEVRLLRSVVLLLVQHHQLTCVPAAADARPAGPA